jgi:hypothetical protein
MVQRLGRIFIEGQNAGQAPLSIPLPMQRALIPKHHCYVLRLNACDHDVSACLLRDGGVAVAITRESTPADSTRGD